MLDPSTHALAMNIRGCSCCQPRGLLGGVAQAALRPAVLEACSGGLDVPPPQSARGNKQSLPAGLAIGLIVTDPLERTS